MSDPKTIGQLKVAYDLLGQALESLQEHSSSHQFDEDDDEPQPKRPRHEGSSNTPELEIVGKLRQPLRAKLFHGPKVTIGAIQNEHVVFSKGDDFLPHQSHKEHKHRFTMRNGDEIPEFFFETKLRAISNH